MTELLYMEDSYLREFTATVTEVTEEGAVLDRTAFYPQGGGQPSDTGMLTDESGVEYPVTKVQKVGGKVVHRIEGSLPAGGSVVTGQIDWDRRYRLMRTHTALHILCGVIWRDYGASVTGGNMEPLKARMDFELESMSGFLRRGGSQDKRRGGCRPTRARPDTASRRGLPDPGPHPHQDQSLARRNTRGSGGGNRGPRLAG
jgi:Ser-tRNA(Ala) deacylase AlaX